MNNLAKLKELEKSDASIQEKKSQSSTLIDLCEGVELFSCLDGNPHATLSRNGHSETWPLKSIEFKNWLRQQYFLKKRAAPSELSFKDALSTLEAKAEFEGKKIPVYLRTAHLENLIYVDLSNEHWEVVEVSEQGWRIVRDAPVKFRREKRMSPLPRPTSNLTPGDAINRLRKFVNVESDQDFKLLIAWLLSILGTSGPYLVLVLYGEHGTAKSTTVKSLRGLSDPNSSPLRRPPRCTDDLMTMAKGNFVIAIDNMSTLPDWFSDDLCVLSTGGGLSKRKQYSDDEEVVLDARRPIILNGIDEFVVRGDLASRAIFLNLPVIAGHSRMPEKDLLRSFVSDQDEIFGALLSAIAVGIRYSPVTSLSTHPRMADAWRFITAAESAFGWLPETCLKAFHDNQLQINDVVLNSSPLFPFIQEFADFGFSGTPQELLSRIRGNAHRLLSNHEPRLLPVNPKTLSDRLRRLSPSLRHIGIEISFEKTAGTNSKRIITIKKLNSCDASVACVANRIQDGDMAVPNQDRKMPPPPTTRGGMPRPTNI